jgi:integrase
MALTEKKLKALSQATRVESERIWDTGGAAGLHATVSPTGVVSFAVKYRYKGTKKREGLGRWPSVSLEEARRRVYAIRGALDRKLPPPTKLESEVRTFSEAADYWLAVEHKDSSKRTIVQITRYLNAAKKEFGHMALNEVRAPHVLAAMMTFQDRGRAESARRLRMYCSLIFSYFESVGLCERDPTDALRKRKTKRPVQLHHASMPYGEIPAFLKKLAAANLYVSIRAALRFLILTGMRTGEVLELRWSDIARKDVSLTIPAERMKARRPHTVFLSKQAKAVLAEAREFSEGREYVFPGRDPDEPLSNMSMLMALTRKENGKTKGGLAPGYTVHGFRASFSSWAHAQGEDHRVVERCLAHVDKDKVAAAYNRHHYNTEAAQLWQKWADFCAKAAK